MKQINDTLVPLLFIYLIKLLSDDYFVSYLILTFLVTSLPLLLKYLMSNFPRNYSRMEFKSLWNIKSVVFYCIGSCLKFKSYSQIWRQIHMDKSQAHGGASLYQIKTPTKKAYFLVSVPASFALFKNYICLNSYNLL